MIRSSDVSGILLIVFGVGCILTALPFADEWSLVRPRSPMSLAIFGCLGLTYGVILVVRTRLDDGTGAMTRTVRMLHPLVGRSEVEIRKWLGAPQNSVDEGRQLTWHAPRYSITLRFHDGVCVEVVGETANEEPTR